MIALFGAITYGQKSVQSYTDRVSGGSLSTTNVATGNQHYELKNVTFTILTSAITNVASIVHVRPYLLPDIAYNVVSTNLTTGGTQTNVRYRIGGHVAVTNTYTLSTTTNDTTLQTFDCDDFGRGLVFEPSDVVTFSFTDTNNVDLIRTYNIY